MPVEARELVYTKGTPHHCLLLSKSPGKPDRWANTCSSPCSGNAALRCCGWRRQPRNPVGKRLRSLARLARVVELSARLRASLEVLVEGSYGWKE